mgnify:CR=1 FL=1
MTDIEYPTFTSKIGIDPLLCRVDNDADNIFNLEVNGNLCDKQKGQNDSCQGDNVFTKQLMIERLNQKYSNMMVDIKQPDKNNIIEMMKHPNYSKVLCHGTLSPANRKQFADAVLPYNYDGCTDDNCKQYKNSIYGDTNTIPHTLINYSSSTDKAIYEDQLDKVDTENKEICNNFYKVYCEKLNSMLKDKFGDKFDTSMLGKYENMCLCYQDLYKDYLPARVYIGFSGFKENDAAQKLTDVEISSALSNGAKMIDPVCDYQVTQIGTNGQGRYAPITNKNWNSEVSLNIAICNNTLNMNDTNIESNDDSTIKFNQSSLCSANSNPTPDNTPKTDDKTTDKSDITDKDNQTNIKDNTETKDNEQLPNDSNINDSNSNLESTKDKIINKIKENKTYAGIGGGVSLCCCCICCICIIMALSK